MASDMGRGTAMAGRTVVMTGATSGIGAVAAEELAARGARLVIIARDPARAARTMERLRAANPAVEPAVHFADLSRLAEVKRVAAALADAEPRIDVLANNAGAIFGTPALTEDGLERTFATNHLAAFVLTLGLRAQLAAPDAARVVTTASAAHRGQRLDPADIGMRGLGGLRAYGRSKLYNILFTRELARRWTPLGITATCFHPGFVATRFGDSGGGWLKPAIALAKTFAITPAEGARTLIHLASAPEVAHETGRYFVRSRPAQPQAPAEDDTAAAALWDESLRLAGLG